MIFPGTGMVAIAIPILIGKDSADSRDFGVSDRTQYYAIAKSLMVSGSDAMERLMTSYKVRFTSYTLTLS
jgi:ATP-binding cassette subfamily D (ALD) protein 2